MVWSLAMYMYLRNINIHYMSQVNMDIKVTVNNIQV